MQLICGRGIHPGRSGQSRSIGARCSSFSEGLRVGQQHVKLVLLQNTMDFYITVAFVIPLSFPSFPSPAHRPGGGFYQLRSASSAAPHEPRQHTQQPIVTGTHPRAHVFLFFFSVLLLLSFSFFSFFLLSHPHFLHRIVGFDRYFYLGSQVQRRDHDGGGHTRLVRLFGAVPR